MILNSSLSSLRIRRQQRNKTKSIVTSHGKNNESLNQTLENFYNVLKKTQLDQSIESAKNWVNEYEMYRKL